jgi:hypothetical protein
MKILINDFNETQEEYIKIFNSFGYEENELIFSNSYETSRDFIINQLEKNKLHIDLIITNNSREINNDVLKANELQFFKNSLFTSFSKGNFRLSSIPIVQYSNYDTKSDISESGFNAIIKKNEYGDHKYFVHECERLVIAWRKQLYSDLEVLEIKIEQLTQLVNSNYFNKYYFQKISNNSENYFAIKTKVVSNEFIKAPTPLNYDWIVLSGNDIAESILKYTDTYKNHLKYDRKNGERAVLHEFFKEHRTILLRDTYVDLEYELNLNEINANTSEECDFILKTEYPDFLKTTFFEVKKEDVTFYVKKNTKRPQFSSDFLSNLKQVWGYKEYVENPLHQIELKKKLNYETSNFDYVLLAGRIEEKEEMKHLFEKEIQRMFEDIKVITYEELENININYLEKFNRLAT